ncbi:hypothetical protein HC891_23965 [Candidatus Gracilibacteria bacterium]|nr:hypothetical protein [Candidatus Gracilibacteria bacterium]
MAEHAHCASGQVEHMRTGHLSFIGAGYRYEGEALAVGRPAPVAVPRP